MTKKRSGLGRGLGSLFADMDDDILTETSEKEEIVEKEKSNEEIHKVISEDGNKNDALEIVLERIFANPDQPRKIFDETAMNELADSIKNHGVIQPIIVVRRDDKYMIVAGERRWRASKVAGLTTIPAIIRNFSDRKIKEISLLENLQRQDLNAVEAAKAIKQLMDDCKLTQEEVADRLGKSRSAIANLIRLLTLNEEVLKLIDEGKLSAGHARCLVVVKDENIQVKLALKSCNDGISVRDLEKLVKDYLNPKPVLTKPQQSPELKDLISEMQKALGTKVSAVGSDNKGRIYIDYFNRDDLDRIYDIIKQASIENSKNN